MGPRGRAATTWVRVIRMSRPWVVLSRFQGNARDGHGNHSAAGVVAVEASRAAGDPARFPEQIAEGLRPWQPYKVYIGGVRENEDWTVRIDSGEYSPWLGDSFDNIARLGLSFQRSQNGGRFVPGVGPNDGYYKRVAAGQVPVLRETPSSTGFTPRTRRCWALPRVPSTKPSPGPWRRSASPTPPRRCRH